MDLSIVLTRISPILSAAQLIYLNEKPIQLGSLLDVKPGLLEEKIGLSEEKPDLLEEKPCLLEEKPGLLEEKLDLLYEKLAQLNPNNTIIHGLTEDK